MRGAMSVVCWSSSMASSPLEPLLVARRAERDRLVDLARGHVEALDGRLHVSVAIVAGSVARGDFNRWSDIDLVLVVEDELPDRIPDRAELVERDRPGRVQPIAFTPGEIKQALRRRNRLLVEALDAGIVLRGEERLAGLVGTVGT